ncbi:glycoside hydrolase family 3 N-terminal domain-containing protein [Leifsonia sp. C5G2]|uniref:glycoside hydrolase family 3 N-terminal domain-containing protein n=1 Tax=Leifsonia sp. C5G2 TaxID=2735269 RepID=UPI001585B272|nr:glycoside hydrolase family 3 N-terminal domain-containing protein [Leifsonia sp. C5G2]NUU06606.1 glycoside hydrolase family 3 protein [Leifsonia sp. C5G2]
MPSRPSRPLRALALTAAAVVALAVAGCTGGGVAAPRTGAGETSAGPTRTPTPAADPAAAYVDARLRNMTLRQKVASLFMLHAPGTDPAALRGFVDRYGLGGIILMGDNIPATPDALAAETAATRASDPSLPPLVGIDEEGGDVTRLPWDGGPGAVQLRSQPAEATKQAFAQRAQLLRQVGVSVNFGTVADVTSDPSSFIFDRVLGTDPASAAERVAASVAGQKGLVLSTLKHFPGHGETDADSHLTVPTAPIDLGRFGAQDEPSFRAGIDAGADLVMFGHLVYSGVDAQPASLSAAWHRILTDRLGFRGVSITDDLRMLQDTGLPQYQDAGANAVAAVAAGNTMVLMVQGAGADPDAMIDAVTSAVADGRIPVAQVDAQARKLLSLRHSLAPKE